MRSVELFCGAGGLGLGLAAAGFEHEIVCDTDQGACDTIRLNQRMGYAPVSGWQVRQCDAEGLDLSDVPPGVDLLAGGPPCQPFSIGGKLLGQDDPRNKWPVAIRAVGRLRPRAFCFENVRNMATKFSDYLDYVVHQLALPEETAEPGEDPANHLARLSRRFQQGTAFGLSYRVGFALMDAADYGTAQHRERVFVVGYRSDVGHSWLPPKPTHSADELFRSQHLDGTYWEKHGLTRPDMDEAARRRMRSLNQRPLGLFEEERRLPHRTVRDAIADLGEPTARGHGTITGHEAAKRVAKSYKGHTCSPADAPSKALRAGVHGVSGGENAVDLGDGRLRHYTVREAARIQGFPDEYSFAGGWSSGLRQLGNAVAVEVSTAVGRSIGSMLHA